jgi:hypothetical protein
MIDLEQEKQLVERAKNDTQAFGELYEQYYPPIFGYALRRDCKCKKSPRTSPPRCFLRLSSG